MKTFDPMDIARRRVKRGVAWLDRHAPEGWRRNLFDIFGEGRVSYRGHDSYDNECPLALAFEHRADLANYAGYVTYASVVKHFKLCTWQTISFGFDAGFFAKFARGKAVMGQTLDAAWEEAIFSYAHPEHTPHRHDVPLARLNNVVGDPKVGRRRLIHNLFRFAPRRTAA